MKKAFFLLTAIAAFASCSKGGSDDNPTPTPGGVVVKEATQIVFGFNDVSGNPTRLYLKNTNTGESTGGYEVHATGTYTFEFRGLGGRPITGSPRAGTSNVVGFDAGVNDTFVFKLNGVEKTRYILKNDAMNIVNGGIFVDRMGLETNAQAGARLNTYAAPGGPMSTAKFRVF